MALVKPIVNEIVAFDASVGTTITFTANGGDQVTGNEIKIVTNSGTQTTVYSNTVTSYNLSHDIPPLSGLENGNYYKLAIRTLDVLGNTSEWSNYQPFYCYATPTLSFNIYDGQTIRASHYNVILTYNQEDEEKVDYATIKLYDNNNRLVSDSGKKYNSTTPPLTFSYTISNLENHMQYTLVGTVLTINGTIVEKTVRFYVNMGTVIVDTDLTVTLNNCDGYVNLHSSVVSNVTGTSNPSPATYINNKMVDLLCPPDIENEIYSKWVKFSGMYVPTNFLFRTWFYPAKQPYHIAMFESTYTHDYINIVMNRSATEDYITIESNNGTHIDTSLGMHCNGNTKVFLWLCVVDDIWTVQTQILDTEATSIVWENTPANNIKYNVDADIPWGSEPLGDYIPSGNTYVALESEMNVLKIGNGIFDDLNITKDTDIPYTTVVPTWTTKSILCINFNGNLNNNGAPNYTRLLLKRKDDTMLTWLNLADIAVLPNTETYIDFNDSFIPTGIEQTYALVTYVDNIPSDPYEITVTPTWSKYFLSDKDNRFTLNYAVIYSNHSQNIQNGVFMPIGAKYPIVVQNGEGNYRSGSLQFKVLGYQYEIDKRLNRVSIIQQLNDILKFLTNGKAKCLTDFNGNIFILKVINSPQISYDANWGNGIATVSFDWVEQTEYDNYEGMLELGLFDYIAGD